MASLTLHSTTSFPDQFEKIKTNIGVLAEKQPTTMQAFMNLHQAAGAEGVLDVKTKELLALAIGVTLRCDSCIAYHTHDALEAGASPEEILEVLDVAILMGGGPSLMYALHVVEALEQFRQETV